jgi:glycosyltransferase involved in cell wall biosynthesis
MLRGGAEEYALCIARGAAAAGWETHLATPQSTALDALHAEARAAGVRVHALRIGRAAALCNRRPRPLPQVVECAAMWLLLAWLRPAHVHVVLPGPLAAEPLRAARALWGGSATACHQLAPAVPPPLPRWRRRMHAWFRARGERWIAVSAHGRDFLAAWCGAPPDSVQIVHNGADAPPPPDDAAALRVALRRELGLPDDARVLLTVARLDPQKAHELLLPGAARLAREDARLHWVWIGGGSLHEALSAGAARQGLAGRVHLTGYRPDAAAWLHAADLCLFPTHYEGFPLALIEAAAAGLPILASRVGSIPEFIVDGEHGRLVDNTPEAWEAATRRLLAEPETQARLGAAARTRAAAFTRDAMLRATLEQFPPG